MREFHPLPFSLAEMASTLERLHKYHIGAGAVNDFPPAVGRLLRSTWGRASGLSLLLRVDIVHSARRGVRQTSHERLQYLARTLTSRFAGVLGEQHQIPRKVGRADDALRRSLGAGEDLDSIVLLQLDNLRTGVYPVTR